MKKVRNALLLYPSIVNDMISHGRAAERLGLLQKLYHTVVMAAIYVFEGFRPDWRMRQKGDCIMTRTFAIEKGQKPTEEQMQEVMEAKKHPIVFGEDSPELSPAMYKAFMSSVIQRNRKKNA